MAPLTRRQLLGAATGAVWPRGLMPSAAGALSINPRETWAANRPPKGPLDEEDPRFLIVHHSASNNGHTGDDAPRILRSFFDYHTGEKGWNDIAYNFLIDADGGVWEGRAGSLDHPVAGDATGGNQGFSQLVCLIGNFDTAEPTTASLGSLVALLGLLADRYDIPTGPDAEARFTSLGSNRHPEGATVTTPTITGHRTMSLTSCPGDNLNTLVVGSLPGEVDSARQPSTTTTGPVTTTTSTTTLPPTTTTVHTSSTTTAFPTTARASSSTLPVAASPSAGSGLPIGIAATAGALVLTGAGVLLWRQRRMGRR